MVYMEILAVFMHAKCIDAHPFLRAYNAWTCPFSLENSATKLPGTVLEAYSAKNDITFKYIPENAGFFLGLVGSRGFTLLIRTQPANGGSLSMSALAYTH